jgi:hypothetical protein
MKSNEKLMTAAQAGISGHWKRASFSNEVPDRGKKLAGSEFLAAQALTHEQEGTRGGESDAYRDHKHSYNQRNADRNTKDGHNHAGITGSSRSSCFVFPGGIHGPKRMHKKGRGHDRAVSLSVQ